MYSRARAISIQENLNIVWFLPETHPWFRTVDLRALTFFLLLAFPPPFPSVTSFVSPAVSPLVARIIEFPVISRRNTLYLLCRGMRVVSPGPGVQEK